jgi:hypothetical protein
MGQTFTPSGSTAASLEAPVSRSGGDKLIPASATAVVTPQISNTAEEMELCFMHSLRLNRERGLKNLEW